MKIYATVWGVRDKLQIQFKSATALKEVSHYHYVIVVLGYSKFQMSVR